MPALGNSQTTFYQRIKAFKLGIHEAEIKAFKLGIHEAEEQKKGVDGSDAGESEQKGSSVEQKKISEGGHSFKGVGKEVEREFQESYHSLVAKFQKQNSKVGNVFEEIGEAVKSFEGGVQRMEQSFCNRIFEFFNGRPDFEGSELNGVMKTMWKQRWLPLIFMRNIGKFNVDGPLPFATRLYNDRLKTRESFSDSLPPPGSDGVDGLAMNAPGKDNNIIYVDVSADTKYVLFASNKKIELKRVDDYTTVWSVESKNQERIIDVAYRMKVMVSGQIFSDVRFEAYTDLQFYML